MRVVIGSDHAGFELKEAMKVIERENDASYVKVLQQGRINPRAMIRVVNRGPATALIDGDNGVGHLVMTYAAETAVEVRWRSAAPG
jgi:ribosomal protein L15